MTIRSTFTLCLISVKSRSSVRAALSSRTLIGVKTLKPCALTAAATKFFTTPSLMVLKTHLALQISATRSGRHRAACLDGRCRESGSLAKTALTSTMLTDPVVLFPVVKRLWRLPMMTVRSSCSAIHLSKRVPATLL